MRGHARHVYRVDGSGESSAYRVVADVPGGGKRGRRVARNAALRAASYTDGAEGHTIVVEPCACGEDALSSYARRHPQGKLAERLEGGGRHG